MCIGCFIGLAQVILKEAWLTVEAGFRPGRQLVLNMPELLMGTSEKAALPFIAFGTKGVEPVHLRILRQADGSYLLEDNHSRTGTFVNGQAVQRAVILRNNDAIQLGVNVVRFRERQRQGRRFKFRTGALTPRRSPKRTVRIPYRSPRRRHRPPQPRASPSRRLSTRSLGVCRHPTNHRPSRPAAQSVADKA